MVDVRGDFLRLPHFDLDGRERCEMKQNSNQNCELDGRARCEMKKNC